MLPAFNLYILWMVVALTPPCPAQRSTRGHPFLSLAKQSPVRAQVGDDVTLPCSFKVQPPIRLAKLALHWLKEGKTVMFLNKSSVYPPHLPFPEETLFQGNAKLELKNVSREDSGIYQCFIQYDSMRNHNNVSLIIQGDLDLEVLAANVPHAPSSPYRKLKIGMVVSVLGISGCLAFMLFCFYAG
ncbi:CD276 antigen-like [Discoglossus pictus]